MSNLKLLLEIFQDQRLILPTIEHPEQLARQLEAFLSEWARWNEKINLTSETEAALVIQKHIFDSLQYARAMKDFQIQVMDIGSGAGFPGIPLKVIFPKLFLVLVESQRKRANFLRNCIRNMGLAKVEVLNHRAEELGRDNHERFDLVLFRGVGEISHCLQLAGPYLKIGGQVALKKEPEAEPPGPFKVETYIFHLKEEISIRGYTGIPSKLMRFEKCST